MLLRPWLPCPRLPDRQRWDLPGWLPASTLQPKCPTCPHPGLSPHGSCLHPPTLQGSPDPSSAHWDPDSDRSPSAGTPGQGSSGRAWCASYLPLQSQLSVQLLELPLQLPLQLLILFPLAVDLSILVAGKDKSIKRSPTERCSEDTTPGAVSVRHFVFAGAASAGPREQHRHQSLHNSRVCSHRGLRCDWNRRVTSQCLG